MRKYVYYYLSFLIIILITLSLNVQTAFAASSTDVLKKGSKGESVTKLQSNLKKLGFLSCSPTGLFGSLTDDAVIKFQKKYNLKPDGLVGEKTLTKIEKAVKNGAIKVMIDPGHGGVDGGTSKGNVIESRITLSISKLLQTYLNDEAFSSSLTRNKDISFDSLPSRGDTRQEKDLNARTNIINKSGAKLFISIHVNSYPESPQTSGSIVFYNDKYPQSKILAQNIQAALNNVVVNNFKRETHNSEEANYYVLRNSNIPGVLVETAFITNIQESTLLTKSDFQGKIAKAILEGIENTKL